MLKVCYRVVVVMGLVVVFGLASTVSARQEAGKVDIVRSLAGMWKAPEYKVAVSSDLDVQVWGRGASKVRNVELSLEPSGDGILRVRTAVVDSRGRTRPFSASVVEARLHVEVPAAASAERIEPVVKVINAIERYLDRTGETRPIDGLKVSLNQIAPGSREMNFRFDTPQGTGSFGDTLIRQQKSAGYADNAKRLTAPNRG